jgi:hypothetical protein
MQTKYKNITFETSHTTLSGLPDAQVVIIEEIGQTKLERQI